MILGFVVIVYPEKYISMPDNNQINSSQEREEINERFLNETNDEIAAASNISEVENIKSGNISSEERYHYLERQKDIQDEGVEGKYPSYLFHVPIHRKYFNVILIITMFNYFTNGYFVFLFQ